MKTRRVGSDLSQRAESGTVASSRGSAEPQEGGAQQDPSPRLGWLGGGVHLRASPGLRLECRVRPPGEIVKSPGRGEPEDLDGVWENSSCQGWRAGVTVRLAVLGPGEGRAQV